MYSSREFDDGGHLGYLLRSYVCGHNPHHPLLVIGKERIFDMFLRITLQLMRFITFSPHNDDEYYKYIFFRHFHRSGNGLCAYYTLHTYNNLL